jgi:hypothetical protein
MQVLVNSPDFSGNSTSGFNFYKTPAWALESSTLVFRQDLLSPEMQQMIEKIIRFKDLEKNWDGYQAQGVSPQAIKDAIHFIFNQSAKKLPLYFAAPGVNGEVMIELKQGNRAAEIFFNPDGITELLLFENNTCLLEGDLETNFEELIEFFYEG